MTKYIVNRKKFYSLVLNKGMTTEEFRKRYRIADSVIRSIKHCREIHWLTVRKLCDAFLKEPKDILLSEEEIKKLND